MKNAIHPTQEQIDELLNASGDAPIYMVNLLKFKPRATYKDGEDISGREAYARYANALSAMVKDQEGFGAIFGGSANAWLIGEGEGEWDAVGIFTYPDAKTMFATVSSDDYRKIHKHRRAGLAGQLLICCDNDGVF